MIYECEFRPGQLESLARAVMTFLEEDGVDTSDHNGLEVTYLSDYDHKMYRLYYTYETYDAAGKPVLRSNDLFVQFHFFDHCDIIENFRLAPP